MQAEQDKQWRRWVFDFVLEELRREHPQLAQSVLRSTSRRVALKVLSSWASCWDPVHLSTVRLSIEAEKLMRGRLSGLVELALRQVLHGKVLSLQQVLSLIDASSEVALGKCVCRASRSVLEPETGLATQPEQAAQQRAPGARRPDADDEACLEELLEAHRQSRSSGRTQEQLALILDALAQDGSRSAAERMAEFWLRSYPYWEILLTHPEFTPAWRQNMQRHGKSWAVDKGVLAAIVKAHYRLRASVFTGMELVGQRYAVCSCPGPERGGGCSLLSWYYHSRLDEALQPNDAPGARVRGAKGELLCCQVYASRASRPCLGCGCEHAAWEADADEDG